MIYPARHRTPSSLPPDAAAAYGSVLARIARLSDITEQHPSCDRGSVWFGFVMRWTSLTRKAVE
ncbi:MAG: hypothetical protein RMJ19_09120 [Gemmatales bacterium]|nr:hypothetical protein [Gemmatales bacterium]MDW8175821.1 hypothetical protein [Gemmatales bacterium]